MNSRGVGAQRGRGAVTGETGRRGDMAVHSHWRRARGMLVTLALGLLAAAPTAADAQQPAKVPRIGFLQASSSSVTRHFADAFRQGLRELAYVEGQNFVIEERWAEGRAERLPDLAADLVRLKVDVIVTGSTPGARAAKQATTKIPIIAVVVGDPVRTGLVASLARPGGNLTGLSDITVDMSAKRLELLKEVAPTASRVAVLWNPTHPTNPLQLRETQIAAQALGLTLQPVEVRSSDELDRAFAAMVRERASALLVLAETLTLLHRRRVAELSARNRLPAMYPFREQAEAGGLMSYGPSIPAMYRRAAAYVDKILKGTKPADLPVEQPMRFEFVINMKTAKALGITFPPSIMVRADRVIQ